MPRKGHKQTVDTRRKIGETRKAATIHSPVIGPGLIPLTQGLYATVDLDDYEWLMEKQWIAAFYAHYVYAVTVVNTIDISMHRYILGLTPNDPRIGLHIDRNRLNNHRSNLIIATSQRFTWNRRPQSGGTSKYKGVYWLEGGWQAEICCDNERHDLGTFGNEIEAAHAYDQAARYYFSADGIFYGFVNFNIDGSCNV